MAVCSEIHTKHINTLCGQNVEFVTSDWVFFATYFYFLLYICVNIFQSSQLIHPHPLSPLPLLPPAQIPRTAFRRILLMKTNSLYSPLLSPNVSCVSQTVLLNKTQCYGTKPP